MSKLTIESENGIKVICTYNPADITIKKDNKAGGDCEKSSSSGGQNVPSQDTPEENFSGGVAFSTSLKLTFDTAELGTDVHEKYVEKLLNMMAIDSDLGRPPECKLIWGSFVFKWGENNINPFDICIIRKIDVTFSLFLPNGTPVRAEVVMDIEQGEDKTLPSTNPTTRTEAREMWVVREGETLDWISYQTYGDAAQWRFLAEVNDIDNPTALRVGQLLKVPELPNLI